MKWSAATLQLRTTSRIRCQCRWCCSLCFQGNVYTIGDSRGEVDAKASRSFSKYSFLLEEVKALVAPKPNLVMTSSRASMCVPLRIRLLTTNFARFSGGANRKSRRHLDFGVVLVPSNQQHENYWTTYVSIVHHSYSHLKVYPKPMRSYRRVKLECFMHLPYGLDTSCGW